MILSRARRSLLAMTSALVGVLAVGALVVVGTAPSSVAAPGSDPFVPGQVHTGDFPDPNVLRVGATYYAYSTDTANLNLPTMTSPDLHTWTALGDTFPRSGSWARSAGGTRTRTWAPSVIYVGDHYVLAYTAPVDARGPRKNCVGPATAPSPRGPFTDPRPAPVVCPPDQGAIDPQVHVAADARPYLLWKTEGVVGREPTKFWVQRLASDGTGFADGSEPHELLNSGRLRLGYAVWSAGRVGYPQGQRRLHVATLRIDVDGLLHVADRG